MHQVDESDARQGIDAEGREVNLDHVDAKCANMPSFQVEMRLLTSRDFIDVGQDESWKSPRIRLFFPGTSGGLGEALIYFMQAEGVSARSLFSTINFSAFGPPVVAVPAASAKAKPSAVKSKPKASVRSPSVKSKSRQKK
ncbi:MAG: hypothetical protein QM684_21965 [Rhizobium sp.]